mmetsp:Transcript_25780/g.38094  ORF Transcript_25780/g.38094 Transcript_25780/m.38094 type:complete len:200 (-) Transcript_25780:743-1342(-)
MHALSYRKESFCTSEEPYILLAEAYLGLFDLNQVYFFLSKAECFIMKNPGISNIQKSRIHRNYGKLLSIQGLCDSARQEFSKDVYMSSLQYGPESVEASIGYALMANVLGMQQRGVACDAFAQRFVEIWKKLLDKNQRGSISDILLKDGMDALKSIRIMQENRYGVSYPLQRDLEGVMMTLESDFWSNEDEEIRAPPQE